MTKKPRPRSEVRDERVLDQVREANEKLLIATVRADELAEKARASEHAKDEFLAMLAHELRNPLAPIVSVLDAIAIREPETLAHELGIVRGQVKQLVRIVDDLLDISRVTQGKIALEIEPLELCDVVARAVETVAPLVERKMQTLRVVASQGLIVDGDFVRLAQVIGNVMMNAAKYTPERGAIEVIAERRGAELSLRIRDTGIGISADMLAHVFDLFVQEQKAVDRSEGGLGLGLTIAQRLVQMHGGSITARSDGVGQGSEFEIVLPAATGVVVEPSRERSLPAANSLRVLVVDDNRLAAEGLQVLLSLLGYDVQVAHTGKDALALAAELAPHVALLDIGLPEMDGYELARRLRELAAPQPIRLIAVTGYGQEADRRRAAEAGFDEHLVKPVAIERLRASLSRVALELTE